LKKQYSLYYVIKFQPMNKKKNHNTPYSFSRTSFILGMGSVLNIAGYSYVCKSSVLSDIRAIKSDWEIVGKDISSVIEDKTVLVNE